MKKRYLILLVLVTALAVLAMTGCATESSSLDGKNIATFELNGGTLDYQSSSSTTKVHFAYHPGTYILDPATIPGYKLYRNDYDFTGWYTSPECKPEEKWDFTLDTFNEPTLTLYAGWEKSINHTFTVCYVDENGQTVSLGEYRVSGGEAFDDWRNFAKNRKDHTPLPEFYSDAACTALWDKNTTHPGGDADLNVNVYVKYIVGEWELVSTYAQLNTAIKNNSNVYLTSNIDCGGADFYYKSFSGDINGNGYTISNFNVPKNGSLRVSCSIFDTLESGAEIKNVSFADATYKLTDINADNATKYGLHVAALAKKANGATIEGVTICGKLETNYTGELPRLNEAVYDTASVYTVNGFEANVTVTASN